MINVDSFADYSSGVGLLHDFSSDIYRDTLRLYKPIVSGERIVKRTAADLSLLSINKLLQLTDENWDRFVDRLNDKIKENPKFKEMINLSLRSMRMEKKKSSSLSQL